MVTISLWPSVRRREMLRRHSFNIIILIIRIIMGTSINTRTSPPYSLIRTLHHCRPMSSLPTKSHPVRQRVSHQKASSHSQSIYLKQLLAATPPPKNICILSDLHIHLYVRRNWLRKLRVRYHNSKANSTSSKDWTKWWERHLGRQDQHHHTRRIKVIDFDFEINNN